MARPTKLTEGMWALARGYIEDYKEIHGHAMPSAVGLARVLGIHRSTLYDWASKDDAFSDILEDVNTEQELVLLNQGVTGVFNSQITKLALGKHGYHDKQDLGGTGEGGGLDIVVRHVSSTTEK